jgi:Na+/melibiose symporter-like transporter
MDQGVVLAEVCRRCLYPRLAAASRIFIKQVLMLAISTHFLSRLLALSVSLVRFDLDLKQVLFHRVIIFHHWNLPDIIKVDNLLTTAKCEGIIARVQTFKREIIFLISCVVVLFIEVTGAVRRLCRDTVDRI